MQAAGFMQRTKYTVASLRRIWMLCKFYDAQFLNFVLTVEKFWWQGKRLFTKSKTEGNAWISDALWQVIIFWSACIENTCWYKRVQFVCVDLILLVQAWLDCGQERNRSEVYTIIIILCKDPLKADNNVKVCHRLLRLSKRFACLPEICSTRCPTCLGQ